MELSSAKGPPETGEEPKTTAKPKPFADYTSEEIRNSAAHVVQVSFSGKVSPEEAEAVLRFELERIAKSSRPTMDVLASAFRGPVRNEVSIKLPDGSTHMVYVRGESGREERIVTWNEYMAEKLNLFPGEKAFEVEMSTEFQLQPSGKGKIIGKTNLPDETHLMIAIRGQSNSYYEPSSGATVRQGAFESRVFNDGGRHLRRGVYRVEITSPMFEFQPPSMQRVMGKKGKLLTGPHVGRDDFGVRVAYEDTFTVE
jgi:hypothetical protein